MTWVIGLRGANYGLALFDTVVSLRNRPLPYFGVYKVQGIAFNAIAGFAGSVEIGLDVLDVLSSAGQARQKNLPPGTRFAIGELYLWRFMNWLEENYLDRYSAAARRNGLELLFISTNPLAEMHEFATQGWILRCPRGGRRDFVRETLDIFTPVSIGSGSVVPTYCQALTRIPEREYPRTKDPQKNYSTWAQASLSISREVIGVLEEGLRSEPVATVGQNLCCSTITTEGLFGPFKLSSWQPQLVNTLGELRDMLRGEDEGVASLVG